MAKKFDASLAKQGMDWMFKVIGERSPTVSTQENVQDALKDGVALCKCVYTRTDTRLAGGGVGLGKPPPA